MLAVVEHEDGVVVTVAYGTSKKVQQLAAGEFAIRKAANKAAYELARLSFDTRFDLSNRVDLPWNDTFFAVPPNPAHGRSPRLGSLHIGMMLALKAAAIALTGSS